MSDTHALLGDPPLVEGGDAALAEALVARACSIFPRLGQLEEVRNVLMKLVSLAQIKVLALPLRAEVQEMALTCLRDLGQCVYGEERDHTAALSALRSIQLVLSHAGEDELAESLGCGLRTLCQRIKAD